jgi:hypothetical protein
MGILALTPSLSDNHLRLHFLPTFRASHNCFRFVYYLPVHDDTLVQVNKFLLAAIENDLW